MKWCLALVVVAGCAPALKVRRTTPPALHDSRVIAIATSGPYALELLGGLRKGIGTAARVEACVVGCPAVGLYASASLDPGPHEGKVLRTCHLEVYEGATWVQPTKRRVEVVKSVRELDECLAQMTSALLEPNTETISVPLDARGPLEPAARAARAGKLDEAKHALEALLRERPELAGAHYNLGVIYEATDALKAAKKAYATARALGPDAWLASVLSRAP
jgi:hypothetical protein